MPVLVAIDIWHKIQSMKKMLKKEMTYMKQGYCLKFFHVIYATIIIVAAEYGYIGFKVVRILLITEEIIKYYPDTLITVTFGATIVRFGEDRVGGTFVAFFHSLSSLAYNWPSTIVLLVEPYVNVEYILITAILCQIVYHNTVV